MLLSGDTWPRGRGPWGGGRGLCGWRTLLPSGSDSPVLRRVPGALDTVQLDGAAGAGQRLGRGSGWPSDGQRTGKDTEKPERPLRNQQDRRGRSAQPGEFLSLLLAPPVLVLRLHSHVPPSPRRPPGGCWQEAEIWTQGGCSANSALCLAPGTSPAGVSGRSRARPACSLGSGLSWMLGNHLAGQAEAKPTVPVVSSPFNPRTHS